MISSEIKLVFTCAILIALPMSAEAADKCMCPPGFKPEHKLVTLPSRTEPKPQAFVLHCTKEEVKEGQDATVKIEGVCFLLKDPPGTCICCPPGKTGEGKARHGQDPFDAQKAAELCRISPEGRAYERDFIIVQPSATTETGKGAATVSDDF